MKREQIFKQKNDSLGQSIYIVGRSAVHNLWNGNINDTDVENKGTRRCNGKGCDDKWDFFVRLLNSSQI